MNLARNIVDNNIVAASGLIPRGNIFNQKSKRGELKSAKKNVCKEENIPFISLHNNYISWSSLY